MPIFDIGRRYMSYLDFDFPHAHMYNSDLKEILCIVKKLDEEYDILTEWKRTHEEEYEVLKEFMDNIENGDFPQSMYSAMVTWLQTNAYDIIGGMIKHVYFGLTDDGYFCAFIPENWSDVQFDTVSDYNDPLYGHLVLMYD